MKRYMMKRKQHELTAGELTLIHPALNADYKRRLLAAPVPHSVCGRNVPPDLNGLTLDGLEDILLSEGGSFRDRIVTIARVVLGVSDEKRLMRSRAADVVALVRWTGDECRRIAGLFDQIKRPFTDDERAAGIEELNFGIFGVADWYAQRMGITDHNAAKQTPWVRIYKCMEMDAKTREVNRRLAEIERKRAEANARRRR